ncbi:MAG TPA: hypothetical protein V6D28_04975 [Leptolyngbyaceae cyanobacterium]
MSDLLGLPGINLLSPESFVDNVSIVYVNGTNGDDVIYGAVDNEIINGFAGNDVIFSGIGNDIINGGDGYDYLSGDAGDDMITGGAGADTFWYATAVPFAAGDFGVDTITDFTPGEDKFILDKLTFSALTSSYGIGFNNPTDFAVVDTDEQAAFSMGAIVYSKQTGNLFYNQNGVEAGFGSGAQFAHLSNLPVLSSNDFIITILA